MSTRCYSVRVMSIKEISEKAYKIKTFDGSEDIFPKSAVFGADLSVGKSEAYWIAAWILPKKSIQYSSKKSAVFNNEGVMIPDYEVVEHIPSRISAVKSNIITELKK